MCQMSQHVICEQKQLFMIIFYKQHWTRAFAAFGWWCSGPYNRQQTASVFVLFELSLQILRRLPRPPVSGCEKSRGQIESLLGHQTGRKRLLSPPTYMETCLQHLVSLNFVTKCLKTPWKLESASSRQSNLGKSKGWYNQIWGISHPLTGGRGTRLSIRRQDQNNYSDTETRNLSRRP